MRGSLYFSTKDWSETAYFREFLSDFTHSNFQNKDEEMICQFGMLTTESSVLFRKKLHHVAQEFLALCEQDSKEPIDKKHGSSCILMIRPWAPAIFKKFIKE
ncbi:MAG: hypothetical protein ABI370_06840 [Gammaproteobacteria bacterium]